MLLIIFLFFTLVGCSESNENEFDKASETETLEENSEEIDANNIGDQNYPNVKGYPIEKDDIKLCRVYINGHECFTDGYVKNDNPDVVYMAVLEMICDGKNYGNGLVVEEDGKRSFGACINGKLVVNKLGENILNIDGEIYEDMAPEMRVLFEDYNDYYCSTLLLEKTLGAKVTFSKDRSAVYIDTSEEIDEEKTQMYELDLSGYGKLIAKNKETGDKLILKCGNDEKNNSASSKSKDGSINNTFNYSQPCSACGGTGKTYGVQNVYNPVTNKFEYKSVMVTCISCGGTGRR